jgi:hypothetical protein
VTDALGALLRPQAEAVMVELRRSPAGAPRRPDSAIGQSEGFESTCIRTHGSCLNLICVKGLACPWWSQEERVG